MTDKSFQHTLKQIYKAQDKIAPLIEGLEDELPQQSMQDYFVNLQILIKEDENQKNGNYGSISGEKKEVELADIFEKKLTKDGIEPAKILVLGGAGVGKTTLMQYIAYKWGAGELWQDRFDYVYRVSLKTLLNDYWKDDYSNEELREDILKCLVHYNLVMRMDYDMDEPALKEMHWSADTEKTLLLLDGYDEIAYLKNSNTPNKDYQRLEKKIFEHKNLIFTSRLNAINKTMKTQFDRVLENTGLTKSGIDHYFSIFFRDDKKGSNKEAELRRFLARNQVIWPICSVPVNIALLCYIWSTSKSSDGLQEISTVSSLYKNLIYRLGQRYFAKEWNDDDRTDKVTLEEALTNGKFILDELTVLSHVAYKALTGGGINVAEEDRVETLIIRGAQEKDGEIDVTDKHGISVLSSINYLAKHKMIQDDPKNKVTVGKVFKYGLLKVEETVSVSSLNSKESDININAQRLSYSFLHLTFQEYLAAYYLKEQLTSDQVSEKEKRAICQYLAEHRNEPRYLMMLKFMAGIIAADQSTKAGEYAEKVFWDAMICNVDGVIELGIGTKNSFLMHLLGQAKVDGKMDPRNPHKDQVSLLVDAVVLSDLFGWVPQLKESDYMTDTIKEAFMHALTDDNLIWSNNKLAEIKAKSSSSLQDAIDKIIGNKSGKEQTESEQSSGGVTALALRMINEVNLKLTPDERLTIVRKLKHIIMTHEKHSSSLVKQAIQELERRIPGSPLPEEEIMDILDVLIRPNNSFGSMPIELIVQIIKASGKKDILVKAMEKFDSLHTHEELLAMDINRQLNSRINIRYYTAKIVKVANDKTLIPIEFEKIIDCLNKSQESLDASKGSHHTGDSSLADALSELFSSADDNDFVIKAFKLILDRAKQRNYQGLMTSKRSISKIISKLKDKDVITACVTLVGHLLSSEESQATQECALEVLRELTNLIKDKTIAFKTFEVVDHFVHDKKVGDGDLMATGIKMLGEVLAVTEDPVFAKKEMDKIFKLLEGTEGSSKKIAIEGVFKVVEMCKDKGLAIKLMEYICGNDLSAPGEILIEFAITVQEEKEVMAKFIEYISRSLSDRKIYETIDLIFQFFEVFEDKYETSKIIETLISMSDNDEVQRAIMYSRFKMNGTLQVKIIKHAMHLLDNDNAQIRCKSIDFLRYLIKFRNSIGFKQGERRAVEIAEKLAKLLLIVEDLAVKQRALIGIDEMLELIRNDELAAKVVQQHEVLSLIETINDPTPNLTQATVRMLLNRNERESIVEMVDKMIRSFSSQESEDSDDHKICALGNLAGVFQVFKDNELAEKAIDAILKIIPSHLASAQIFKRQSSALERRAAESANLIIKSLEDQKLAMKIIEHIPLSDDPQKEENYSLSFIMLDTIIVANDTDLTTKLVPKLLRFSNTSFNTAVSIIANFWVPLEQALQYLQSEDTKHTLIRVFTTNFEMIRDTFITMEKLLETPQNLTIEIINENLSNNPLNEATQTKIKTILSTLKDDQIQSTSIAKLREILLLHLNQIGPLRKHELIEPILAITDWLERDPTVDAHHRLLFINKTESWLEFQIKHLDKQGLEWINKNFDKLVALSKKSKFLFRKLYHKLLEDGEITSLEEELIVKFINQGLTTLITRNKDINFEGKRYKIKSQNVAQLLDAIATAVIDQDRDPLALQYKTHKPIFSKKSESGMKKASADVEEAYSAAYKAQGLSSDQWILSELRDESQGALLLLEKRSPIGDHIVYKLDQSSRGEHCFIRVDIEDSKKKLEEIFGKYVIGKRFQGRTTAIARDIGNQILSNDYKDFEKVFADKGVEEYDVWLV